MSLKKNDHLKDYADMLLERMMIVKCEQERMRKTEEYPKAGKSPQYVHQSETLILHYNILHR